MVGGSEPLNPAAAAGAAASAAAAARGGPQAGMVQNSWTIRFS